MFSRKSEQPHLTSDELPPTHSHRPPPLPANDDAESRNLHPELDAMDRIYSALFYLDGPGRARVLEWVVSTLEINADDRYLKKEEDQ